jgi:hypothetical protein
MLLLLIGSLLFSVLALVFLAAYFITGGKKMILARLAGGSIILASLFWILQSRMR